MRAHCKTNPATFPGQGTVHDAAGLPVDCSGLIWTLNYASRVKKLDWRMFSCLSAGILKATVLFIRQMIETQSPSSVQNAFRAIMQVQRSAAFTRADETDDVIPFGLFPEMLVAYGDQGDWRLHYIRQWYSWCADFGFANFSLDVSFESDQLRIGGNAKGKSVLSADPVDGPLSDVELAALLVRLRASSATTRQQKAALWLCIALGPNPAQMAMLTEADLLHFKDGDNAAFVHLRVPRIKKREHEVRAELRTRALTTEIGKAVQDLIQENHESYPPAEQALDSSRPVFWRAKPRPDLVGAPLAQYAMHLTASEFTELVQSGVRALGVISPRTRQPLKITTRRLRYTFATRLVREGVSKLEVADLLDHTDTQNVQVYFDVKSDIVEHLDKAVAMTLAPIAQAFMGKLVMGAENAVRGDDPDSSIAAIAGSPKHVEKLGNCGSFGFCGLMAPIACYTCKSFQPWLDAPHHLVLHDLLANRERRVAAGLDGRMISMHDTTICAVAEVITKIGEMQAAR